MALHPPSARGTVSGRFYYQPFAAENVTVRRREAVVVHIVAVSAVLVCIRVCRVPNWARIPGLLVEVLLRRYAYPVDVDLLLESVNRSYPG